MSVEFEEDPRAAAELGGSDPALDTGQVDPGASPEFDDSPEALRELLEAEAAAETELEAATIPPVSWAADRDQPDFAHTLSAEMESVTVPKRFAFDRRIFDLLVRANHFRPKGTSGLIAFGLRGGRLVGDDAQLDLDSVTIEDTRPDHSEFRCTLGIIDTNTGRLSAFCGSTVPNRDWMRNYYKIRHDIRPRKKTKCNILPTGCYIYRVNAHGNGRIKPALRMTDPDDLRADAACTVLRTSNDLAYGHDDFWDRTVPYDNIHCAYSDSSFSSAGCQTIKGADRKGAWGTFQSIIAGLGWDARIDYVLVTGREAAIAAAIHAAGRDLNARLVRSCLERLRVGSEGDHVRALQKKLGFGGSAYFGPSTKKRLTQEEAALGLDSDGIYSPEDDLASGWAIFPPILAGEEGQGAESPELHLVDASTDPSDGGKWNTAESRPGLRFEPAAGRSRVSTQARCTIDVGGRSYPVSVSAAMSSLPPVAAGVWVGLEIALSTTAQASPVAPGAPEAVGEVQESKEKIAFSAESFDAFAPNARSDYRDLILSEGAEILGVHRIATSTRRLAHFLAQIGHESGGFRLLVESLFYTSAERLMQVWPRRFPTRTKAAPFVRDEEALAEKVYGGRLGNNEPGDGFRYRGRGLIQLTGRGAYQEYSDRLDVDLVGNPDLAFEPRTALRIAAEYWASRKLRGERSMNALADDDKIRAITYRVNGGFTNFADREEMLSRAKKIWGDDGPITPSVQIVERGDFNDQVRDLQSQLITQKVLAGTVDGKFGYNTYMGLRRFKEAAGLDGVGYADPATFDALRKGVEGAPEGLEGLEALMPIIGDDPEPIRNGVSLDPAEAGADRPAGV